MTKIGLYSGDRTLFPLLSSALGKQYQITLRSDEDGMNDLVASGDCDVAILDLNPNCDCLGHQIESFHRWIASIVTVPVVVMGDDAFRSTAFELVRRGAFGYCGRPPSIRELKTMLSRAHETAMLKKQLRLAQEKLDVPLSCDRLIGSSPQMQRVYQLVQRVTNVNASVLVTGDSGTGKELIARAIHNLGSRAGRPFVAVSCSAIPETLIEAELFGHERGAFTGTVGMREGYLEQADDGTLFLDEIGDLSLQTQVKLLRVLQQMEFNRLGSNHLIPLKARLIFATNRDLPKMVSEGTFRQDLFYRINVLQIVAPPLREHIEDVPLIASHFLRHYSQTFRNSIMDIEPDAFVLLQGYTWPGNVRELENVMQRAIVLAPGSTVRVEDLVLNPQEDDCADTADLVEFSDYNPACSFERQLRDYKIKLAVAAVRENSGNKTLAARTLGISRAYLHRLIRLADSDSIFELDAREEVRATV
jgi:DNA-binding NtrC family response regulator